MDEADEAKTSIAELFPHLTEKEIEAVKYDIRRYLELVKRIYDYVEKHDPKTLTELRRRANVMRQGGKSA